MTSILVLFILGVVQGITEFLPVSSSGHLVLFSKLFAVEESLFLSILLHGATLLSIVVVFWKDIIKLIKNPFSSLGLKIIVATIPTCLIAIVVMPLVKVAFGGVALPYCFIITAILLFASELISRRRQGTKLTMKHAIIMGVAQGFAVFPGISRSGSTISAGVYTGAAREECVTFSFLMSIPIILASMVMEVFDICRDGLVIEYSTLSLIVAFVSAFIFGIIGIKFMKNWCKNYFIFSIYLLILGIVTFYV